MKRAVDIFVKATLITAGLASPSLARQDGDKRILIWESRQSQCAAEAQQRHKDIVTSMHGRPTHEIAQAIADSDAKNPSPAECARKKSGGGGGGDDTAPMVQNNRTGDPELDGANDAANASAVKTPTTPTTTEPPKDKPKPNPRKTEIEIGSIAAVGGLTTLLVTHGGGGGTTPPGETTPTDFSGSYSGEAQNVPASTTCSGVTPSYAEHATLSKQGSGYQVTLSDNPSFGRSFILMPDAQGNYSASGTAPFNATETYTGNISVVGGVATMKLNETSNFGTCSSLNSSVLTKQ